MPLCINYPQNSEVIHRPSYFPYTVRGTTPGGGILAWQLDNGNLQFITHTGGPGSLEGTFSFQLQATDCPVDKWYLLVMHFWSMPSGEFITTAVAFRVVSP